MRSPLLVAALVTLAAVSAAPAMADGTYHSAHIELNPITGTSDGSGFVQNAHANGPNIYAHEQYQLRHATPGTDYDVVLHIYMRDPTCRAVTPDDLFSTELTTNAAGNASGSKVFTPSDAAPLPKNIAHGIIWTMTGDDGTVYASGCETVILD